MDSGRCTGGRAERKVSEGRKPTVEPTGQRRANGSTAHDPAVARRCEAGRLEARGVRRRAVAARRGPLRDRGRTALRGITAAARGGGSCARAADRQEPGARRGGASHAMANAVRGGRGRGRSVVSMGARLGAGPAAAGRGSYRAVREAFAG